MSQQFQIELNKELGTPMSCQDADCANYHNGWMMVLNPAEEDHRAICEWIREASGRRYIEHASGEAIVAIEKRVAAGDLGMTLSPMLRETLERTPPGMVVFIFPPGQQCFKGHLDREVVFAHQRGRQRGRDLAGSLFVPAGARRIHTRFEDFREHQNDESYKLARARERG